MWNAFTLSISPFYLQSPQGSIPDCSNKRLVYIKAGKREGNYSSRFLNPYRHEETLVSCCVHVLIVLFANENLFICSCFCFELTRKQGWERKTYVLHTTSWAYYIKNFPFKKIRALSCAFFGIQTHTNVHFQTWDCYLATTVWREVHHRLSWSIF